MLTLTVKLTDQLVHIYTETRFLRWLKSFCAEQDDVEHFLPESLERVEEVLEM